MQEVDIESFRFTGDRLYRLRTSMSRSVPICESGDNCACECDRSFVASGDGGDGHDFAEGYCDEANPTTCIQRTHPRVEVPTNQFACMHISEYIDVNSITSDCFIVFDVETSSLNGCVIQLAWIMFDELQQNVVCSYNQYWRLSDGCHIDPRAKSVHGISESVLKEHGLEPRLEVEKFINMCDIAISRGCKLVAHNASFDVARINYTARINDVISNLMVERVFCTMRRSSSCCGLTTRTGKKKMPTNLELHTILVGNCNEKTLHDALADCRITLQSYIKGKLLGWW